MAGQRIPGGMIDYHDGEGRAVVNGREYWWEYHEYLGPTFLRKDGEPLVRQPGERNPIWPVFERWLKAYRKKRKMAQPHEIVVLSIRVKESDAW